MANEKCEKCKNGEHDWCHRVMRRGTCTCTNNICSTLALDKN